MMTVDDIKVFSDLLNTILNTILFIEGGGEGGKRIEVCASVFKADCDCR